MTTDPTMKRLNTKLETVYQDILRLEEAALRGSQFQDLSIKEMHTIDAIGLHQSPTSSAVAKKLHVTQGTLTVAINQLDRKGYVTRGHEARDKRVVTLTLTRQGRLLYRAHKAFHQRMVQHFVAGFDEADVRRIEQALDNLLAFLAAQD